MKPTSIIFLIVAAVLIGAGLLTCVFAQKTADAKGISIYASTVDENKNTVYDAPLDDYGITKFEIAVSGAEVNVIGGAESSHVELINFSEGMYSYTQSGKVVTVNETPDIMSMLKFWENGFNFNGLRYFIRFGMPKAEEKVVNIYLTKDDEAKIIKISTSDAPVTIRNVNTATDYEIKVDGGDVIVANVRTSSSLSVTGKCGEINIDQSYLRSFRADLTEGDVVASALVCSNASVKSALGDVSLGLSRDLALYNMRLSSESGTIKVGDAVKTSPYEMTSDAPNAVGDLIVELEAGSMDIFRKKAVASQ